MYDSLMLFSTLHSTMSPALTKRGPLTNAPLRPRIAVEFLPLTALEIPTGTRGSGLPRTEVEFLSLKVLETPTGAKGSAMKRSSPLHMKNLGGSVNTRRVKEVTLPNR